MLALLVLEPFLIWPLGSLVWQATLDVLRDPGVWNRLVVTTEQAFLSTLLAAAIGLPTAYVLSQIRFPGHRIVRFVATGPLVLPTIVVALAFRQLLGVDGWLHAASEGIGTL